MALTVELGIRGGIHNKVCLGGATRLSHVDPGVMQEEARYAFLKGLEPEKILSGADHWRGGRVQSKARPRPTTTSRN